MKHVFTLTRFETRADRPLFTGDAGAYVLRVVLPEEVENGVLTAASFRPDTENPVLSSASFSGNTAEVTLVTGQYDKEGETKILCTVTDGEGEVLTTRVLYATVLTGIAGGTVGKDDYTQLTQLISLAGEAVSDCSGAVSAAESAISACQDAASRAEQAVSEIPAVPTKVSDLENDSKFIQNIGTDIDEYRKVIQIGDDSLYSLTLTAYELDIIGNTSGYLHITNLSDPENDYDAANKKYVDDSIPTDYLPTSIGDTQTVETYGSGKLYIVTARGGQLFIGGDADTVYMTGLMTPTSNSDAANKAYVDSAIASAITATLSTAV